MSVNPTEWALACGAFLMFMLIGLAIRELVLASRSDDEDTEDYA